MRIKPWLLIVATVSALLLAGCGDDGAETGTSAGRQVTVKMKELKFDPASVNVTAGETVTFVFTNDDTIRHDAFVGDEAAQDKHESEMASAGSSSDGAHGGSHDMESSDAIIVEPGKTGEITHTFDEAGTILIGCHEPGHYAGGMKMTIAVG
jgi:uncharacterized cupredoxin-like copper-binding protein